MESKRATSRPVGGAISVTVTVTVTVNSCLITTSCKHVRQVCIEKQGDRQTCMNRSSCCRDFDYVCKGLAVT